MIRLLLVPVWFVFVVLCTVLVAVAAPFLKAIEWVQDSR